MYASVKYTISGRFYKITIIKKMKRCIKYLPNQRCIIFIESKREGGSQLQ